MLTDQEAKLLDIMENFGENITVKFDEKEIIKKLVQKISNLKHDFVELQRKYSEMERNNTELKEKYNQIRQLIKEWQYKLGEISGNPPEDDKDSDEEEEWDLDNDKD